MSLHEITNKVNQLASHWEQFKTMNDKKLKDIERKGSSDPIVLDQLKKIGDTMDGYTRSIEKIKTALDRPRSEQKDDNRNVENLEYKNAFCQYLRRGVEDKLSSLEIKGLTDNFNNDLGYSITTNMSKQISDFMFEHSPMRQLSSVTEIATDALELIENQEDSYAGWSQDALGELDKQKEVQLSKKVIPVYEIYAQPKVTQKLIDDPRIDIEEWLSKKLIDIFVRLENKAFINGDGNGKPRGILTYDEEKIAQIESGQESEITSESIIKLLFSIDEVYASGAKFLMSRDALQKIRMLKDNNGRYLWQPGLTVNTPNTLLGSEVNISADMPEISQGKLPVAFADFSHAYQIVDRQNVKILRDPYTNKPYVKFYTTKRVGGDVVNFSAIKLLKIS